jgi:hypothetical protein
MSIFVLSIGRDDTQKVSGGRLHPTPYFFLGPQKNFAKIQQIIDNSK